MMPLFALPGIVINGFVFAEIWNLLFAYKIDTPMGIGVVCLVGVCTDFGIPDYPTWSEREKIMTMMQQLYFNPLVYFAVAYTASLFRGE